MDNQSPVKDYSSAWLAQPEDTSAPLFQPFEGQTPPSPDQQLASGTFGKLPSLQDLSAIKPHERALLESIASDSATKGDVDEYTSAATNGVPPGEIDKQRAAQHAMDFAQATAGLSEKHYNELVDKLKAELGNTTPAPTQAPLQGPNLAQAALAAYGALTNPKHAYDIGATPFQYQLAKQQQDTAQNAQNYQIAEGQHQERLQALQTLTQFAYRDMVADKEAAQKLNDKQASARAAAIGKMLTANAPGEPTIAFQEAIDAGLPEEKIKMYAPIVQQRESDLKAAFEDQRKKTQESIETSDLRQQQMRAQIDQTQRLLPGKLELQKLGITHAELANKLSQAKVDLIPQTRALMESRVRLSKLHEKWYPVELTTRLNLAAYQAQLSWANFQQRQTDFAYSQDRFSYAVAKDAADRALANLKAEQGALKDDREATQKEIDRILKDYGSEQAVMGLKEDNADRRSFLAASGHLQKVAADIKVNLDRQKSIESPQAGPAMQGPSMTSPPIDITKAIKPGAGQNSPPISLDPYTGKIGTGGTKVSAPKATKKSSPEPAKQPKHNSSPPKKKVGLPPGVH